MYSSKSYRPNRSNSSFSRNGNQRPSNRRFVGQYIDVNKFINKATYSEATDVYTPQYRFSDFAIHPTLKANILRKGYDVPTAIQDQTIPASLQGHDVIGIANTGTGKTAAFLIPLINKVSAQQRDRVLIMAPTRELALQIQQEFKEFSVGLNQSSTLCIGGTNISPQIAQLRRNPQFVIGTPGRLKDLMERHYLDLSHFRSVVLDEADRMLDMGFIADIKMILSTLSPDRQTLFFSATMSPQIEFLTKTFLHDPVMVSVKTQDTAATIEQDVIRVDREDDKIEELHNLLIQDNFSKVLIFGQTKRGVERLSDSLVKRGFKSTAIHGNKSQSQRQRSLDSFKQDDFQILVATDVAARGLDIPDVTHVINYDVPSNYEDYIHRIGRTGRINKKGYALTFVTR